MKLTRRQLPRTIHNSDAAPAATPATVAPVRATVCRTVTIEADVARLAADLERELRVALDGRVVTLVAGRIRR
jgi:hypothetical protein